MSDQITYEMVRAAIESAAKDDEGTFDSLGDLLDFSGENKTRTVVRAALEAAFAVSPLTAERDALLVERGRLRFCVRFFTSVIKCGEPWTETCEKAREDALNAS